MHMGVVHFCDPKCLPSELALLLKLDPEELVDFDLTRVSVSKLDWFG